MEVECRCSLICADDRRPRLSARRNGGRPLRLSLGALLGFSIRALVNWLVRRMRDPANAGWPPYWAIAGLLAVAASLIG